MKQLRYLLSLGMLIVLVSCASAQAWLTNGLVAYYPFNGNANDESGNGNDGTVYGAQLNLDRFGVQESSYVFSGEGSPDNIEITKTNILDSNDYTVSLWFNAAAFPTDSPSSYAMFLISRGRNDVELHLGCPPFQSKGIRFLPRLLNPTTAQVVDVRSAVNYQTNFWYQLIATYEKNGSHSRLFLNGNELEQTAYTGGDGPPDIRSIKIGMRYNAIPGQGLPFKGSIDDIRIYNRALSSNEVAQLYNIESIPPAGFETNGLVAYYPFNGNANDLVGGNNATVSGAALTSGIKGTADSAYYFNGNNAYMTAAFSPPSNNSFTWSVWVKPFQFAGDNRLNNPNSMLLEAAIYGEGGVSPALQILPNGHMLFSSYDGTLSSEANSVNVLESSSSLQLKEWNLVSLTSSGNTRKLYLNGALDTFNNTSSSYGQLISSLVIGADRAQQLYLNGKIDNIRIYNRELSSYEVAQLYALEAPGSPTLTLQPQSVTAVAGSSTNLSVTATGSDVFIYQWLKDGVALAGATNATLVFSNLQPVNVGDYAAVVSNGGGSVTSSVASVSIPGVNSGLWQGLVAYYPFNGNANDESGFGRDGVQTGVVSISDRYGAAGKAMFFDGIAGHHIEIPDSTALLEQRQPFSISSWVRLDRMPTGINSSILSFWGVFAMLATDITGANTIFTEIFGDAFLRSAFHLDPSPNHFHLLVTFNGTTQSTYLNGAQLQTTDDSQSVTFPPRNLVIGGDLYDEDKQTFNGVIDDVRIYNRALSSNDVAALYQSEVPPPRPPAITQNPTDVVATALSPVEFTAAAYSFYPFTYQWQLNGTNLLYATNSTLSILSARQSNVGQYTLIASNAYGSVTSSAANLFLYPYLNAPFTGVVTYWGQTNTLSVGAWGSGSLAYQWYFNGTAIAGATNTTLPLGGIQFTNAGQYSVVVSNSLGSVTNTPYQVVVNPAETSLGLFPGVIIKGTVGYSYTIQATTDLSTTNSWATVTNITLTSPIQIWNDNSSDVHSAGNPQKFYQVIPGQ